MNKPKIATYALGNGPVAFLLMAAFVISAYLWWIGRMSGEMAVVALLFASWASRAHEELTRYRRWCAQWDSYGETGNGAAPATRRGPTSKQLVLLGVLVTWGYLFTTVKPNQPNAAFVGFTLALLGYGAATLVMAAIRAWHRRGRTDTRKQEYDLVAVCAQPAQTPSLHDAYRQLPDYCYRLFQTATRS